jgi:hypothetical protein
MVLPEAAATGHRLLDWHWSALHTHEHSCGREGRHVSHRFNHTIKTCPECMFRRHVTAPDAQRDQSHPSTS